MNISIGLCMWVVLTLRETKSKKAIVPVKIRGIMVVTLPFV